MRKCWGRDREDWDSHQHIGHFGPIILVKPEAAIERIETWLVNGEFPSLCPRGNAEAAIEQAETGSQDFFQLSPESVNAKVAIERIETPPRNLRRAGLILGVKAEAAIERIETRHSWSGRESVRMCEWRDCD